VWGWIAPTLLLTVIVERGADDSPKTGWLSRLMKTAAVSVTIHAFADPMRCIETSAWQSCHELASLLAFIFGAGYFSLDAAIAKR